MNEIWKEYIYNFDVSNKGRIRNRVTGHILKQTPFKNGYYGCVVSCGSRLNKKAIRIHVAVAELFIENPFGYPEVNHKDGNKRNNEVDNLEWCTHSYNIEHAINKGLLKISQGEDHGLAKLKREDVGVERLELSLTSVLETGVLPITPNPYLSHGINFSNSLGTSALLHFTYPFSILCHSVNLLRSVLCDITYSSPERVLQVNNELVSFCGICFANLAFDVPSFIIYLFPLCTF